MSSEGSDQMLMLLKELSVYKAMDEDYRGGSAGEAETAAYVQRERRRHAIAQEMQNLAAEKKASQSEPAPGETP